MNIVQGLLVALRGLVTHRLRSALTILGIVIGVSAVVSLMSIGTGAQAQITAQIKAMGSNLLFVMPGAASEDGRAMGAMGTASLTLEDAQALESTLDSQAIVAVAPQASSGARIVAGSSNARSRVTGTTPEYMEMMNYSLAEGDFISQSQVQSRSSVAVLGSNVAQTLFGDSDPLEQRVRIENRPFRVIGVLQSKGGGSVMGSQDDVVLIPITTLLTRLQRQRTTTGGQRIQMIAVQVREGYDLEAAKAQVAEVLRVRHNITDVDDFTVTSQEDIISAIGEIMAVFTIFLGAIAGISLLVGGIGIMNIMLVSVTERTREIGIRKAVGAKRRDILLQFILEAVFLSLGGGGIGLALGWALSRGIARINIQGQFLNPLVTPPIILLAFGVSAGIGLFFGIYPAFRAARLDPIEALRYQ